VLGGRARLWGEINNRKTSALSRGGRPAGAAVYFFCWDDWLACDSLLLTAGRLLDFSLLCVDFLRVFLILLASYALFFSLLQVLCDGGG
jgi:hypothetical protein